MLVVDAVAICIVMISSRRLENAFIASLVTPLGSICAPSASSKENLKMSKEAELYAFNLCVDPALCDPLLIGQNASGDAPKR